MDLREQLSQVTQSSRAHSRIIFGSIVLTGLCLGGTLSFPFWYGLGLYYSPITIRETFAGYLSPDSTADVWLPIVVLGGVIWGLLLARLSGVQPIWRLGVGTGIGILLSAISVTSPPLAHIHRVFGPQLPVHISGIIDLVVGLGLGGGLTAFAVALVIRRGHSALWFVLGVVIVAALTAFIVAFVLDAIGIRWGAGNANMAKVVGLAFPASTMCAGALIGWYLAKFGQA
jgi:hypothetical protein